MNQGVIHEKDLTDSSETSDEERERLHVPYFTLENSIGPRHSAHEKQPEHICESAEIELGVFLRGIACQVCKDLHVENGSCQLSQCQCRFKHICDAHMLRSSLGCIAY